MTRGRGHREKVLLIKGDSRSSTLKKTTTLSVAMLAVILVGTVPALAQVPAAEEELGWVPVAIVDCVLGGTCIGTSGNDTITGSQGQDFIFGLEGDDTINPGNDRVSDYVSCGPGFDTVNQMPRILPDGPQDAVQYPSEPDFTADDCEVRAL
jgi:hypothetical protein